MSAAPPYRRGAAGFCFIRANGSGKLYSLGYAHPAAMQIDPIEKKPLNHFLLGTSGRHWFYFGGGKGCATRQPGFWMLAAWGQLWYF